MSIVRQSKYRHVFGTPAKQQECYLELRPNVSAWDSDYLKASGKFFAFPWSGGGGSVAVFSHGKGGKQSDVPLLSAHTGRITDLDFSPFNDHVIATGAMDLNPRIWKIPQDGLKETTNESAACLEGHQKRVGVVKFHPVADNVLVSSSADQTIKFWDVKQGKEMLTFDVGKAIPQSLSWNANGSVMATSSKDKNLRLFDPRQNKEVAKVKSHEGTKGFRCVWLNNFDKIFTVGSNRMAERHYMLYDPRKLEEPIVEESIDVGAGIIMPFYDEDTSILYLAGKGDGNIRFFEVENKDPYFHFISAYKSTTPAKGMGCVPKYALDTSKCEVTRLLKLESNAVTPISFCVPRKATNFQSDIYPETNSFESPISGADWFDGKDADKKKISMDPKKNPYAEVEFKEEEIKDQVKAPKTKLPSAASSPKEMKAQNEELRKRVTKLEKENFELKQKVKELEEKLAKGSAQKEEPKEEPKEEEPKEEEPKEEEPKEEEQPQEEETKEEEEQTEEQPQEEQQEEEQQEEEKQEE